MKRIALAALLASTVVSASAQVYVGGALGLTNIECPANVANCDTSDVGLKASLGYRINRLVSLEGSYIDFGKSKFNALFVGGSQGVSGFLVNAALRHDFNSTLTGVGRLGLAVLDTELRVGSVSRTENSTNLYFGLGLEYALAKNLKGTAGADFTTAEFQGQSQAVRMFSLGAQYDF